MLNKCACGRYTDFGVTCVQCAMNKVPDSEEIDKIRIEDLVEEEDSDD